MKKKSLVTLGLAVGMSLSLPLLSYAGEWKQDTTGWWWQNDDGTYPVNKWQWIDGNYDGIAENYYFDENGYCLIDTRTPDNLLVNENGAWTSTDSYPHKGEVQTREVSSFNYTRDSVQGLYKTVDMTTNGVTKPVDREKTIEIKADDNGNITEINYTNWGLQRIDYFPQTGDREWTYTSYNFTYDTTTVYYFPDDNTLIRTTNYSYDREPLVITFVKQ